MCSSILPEYTIGHNCAKKISQVVKEQVGPKEKWMLKPVTQGGKALMPIIEPLKEVDVGAN